MRRIFVSALVMMAVVAPLSAELKVTSKMSVKPVAGAAPATDMMSQMMGPMMLQMFGGTGGVESVAIIHEDGRMRTEYKTAFQGMPAGSVMLVRKDGTVVGFDAKGGTWWKVPGAADMPPEAAAMIAEMKPEITTKKTGQFETIAGLRSERVTMTMRVAIPLPPEAAQLPAEFRAMIPEAFIFEGDSWISPSHAKYAVATAKMMTSGAMAQFGFDKLTAALQGLSMKQVMRMNLLAGYEMETLVTSVVEEDTPDSVFDLPTGLKEIPMPTPQIGG
jgi:hypothetical protein